MTHYKNLAGHVGICMYELGEKQIRVRFHTRKSCLYKAQKIGESHVDKMSNLAVQGYGLNDYIVDNESSFDVAKLD